MFIFVATLAPAAEPDTDRVEEYVRRLRVTSPPADVLGGATLGKPPPAGFACASGDCTKHTTVAGEDGNLMLSLCGDVAQQIVFTVTFVDIRRVEGPAPGIQVSPDPVSSGGAALTRIWAALEQASWMCGTLAPAQQPGGGRTTQSECYAADGRQRSLGLSVVNDPDLGTLTLTQLLASAPTACTSGL